jgi:hypothetical protein
MQNLKKEIDFRYRVMRFKKLQKNFIYNRMEKNNVQIIYEALDDLCKSEERKFLNFIF